MFIFFAVLKNTISGAISRPADPGCIVILPSVWWYGLYLYRNYIYGPISGYKYVAVSMNLSLCFCYCCSISVWISSNYLSRGEAFLNKISVTVLKYNIIAASTPQIYLKNLRWFKVVVVGASRRMKFINQIYCLNLNKML